jgi:ATP-binding cassette subfamily B protein
MDCGPASLKSLLEGFGITASYGRLREACQTSVDGTSIDSIEDLAVRLGLDAEQVMLPLDHLFLEEYAALPALLVTRTPSGLTHFIVAWSMHGKFVQVMDPGVGRRWVHRDNLLKDVFRHTFPLPVQAWHEWALSDGFLQPLDKRMELLQVEPALREQILGEAVEHPEWLGLAALDAAVRLVESLVKTKALERGPHCGRIIGGLARVNAYPPEPPQAGFGIPRGYWSVSPPEQSNPGEEPQLLLHGAVLIKVNSLRDKDGQPQESLEEGAPEGQAPQEISAELTAILEETKVHIERKIWENLRQDSWLIFAVLICAFLISSVSMTLQGYLLQGLFRFQYIFPNPEMRLYALAALFIFLTATFLLELPLNGAMQRVGRRLETRFRVAFLRKIPLLSDRYFHSRLTSDMTSRAHGLRSLRGLPGQALGFILAIFKLTLTLAGVIWLQPASLDFALTALLFFALFGWLSHILLEENDLRTRTHGGALSRFYLDAMQGLLPLRTHSAERAFRRQHEGLMTEWMRSNFDMVKVGLLVQGISALLYALFSAWVGFDFIRGGGPAGGGLLLFYWTLNLPVQGQAIVGFIQQYPLTRNSLLRVLEPLDAAEEGGASQAAAEPAEAAAEISPAQASTTEPGAAEPGGARPGVHIQLDQVQLVAGGHAILEDVNLTIAAGEHLAVVGPSGAGKSSLVGILLGWHKPAAGECRVDGNPLEGSTLIDLRRATAWVDPEVHLWNRSLLENITYGNSSAAGGSNHGLLLQDADLFSVVERLENGMQTQLGEGGGLVSGGEGQRVRLARALNRENVRLVIMDEPFRGLDRSQRRRLLKRARQFWENATLICVTHDVGETLDFPRVLVVENGRVIEDAPPQALADQPESRYAGLLFAEQLVQQGTWASTHWRRLQMEDGRLVELES